MAGDKFVGEPPPCSGRASWRRRELEDTREDEAELFQGQVASGGDDDVSGNIGEGERERSQGEERVSAGSGRGRGFVPRQQLDEGSGEAAGSCVARMLCSPSSSCLPAWPSQAARWSGGWAGPVGGPRGGAR